MYRHAVNVTHALDGLTSVPLVAAYSR